MAEMKLRVIPEPAEGTRAVFVAQEGFKGPFIMGVGALDCLCGSCGAVLLKKIEEGQIKNLVLKCPMCGAYNEIP